MTDMDPLPDEIFGFPVTHEPQTGDGSHATGPVKGVLHTTETFNPAAFADGSFPNVEVSKAKIRMFYGFDRSARALCHDPKDNPATRETNRHVWQAEIVGFTKEDPWLPDPDTLARVAAVVAYASQFHGIPLVRWNPEWGDDLSDVTPHPASNNNRRQFMEPIWEDAEGWGGHMEVPWQQISNHWDPGALGWTDVLQAAQELIGGPDVDETQNAMLRREWFYRAAKADALGIPRPPNPEADDDTTFRGWAQEVAKREIALLRKAAEPPPPAPLPHRRDRRGGAGRGDPDDGIPA